MSALNFGGADGNPTSARYFTFTSPSLPDSDWATGIWMRRVDAAGAGSQLPYVFGTVGGTPSYFVVWGDALASFNVAVDVVNSAGSEWLNEGDGTGLAQDGANYFVVGQRRSNTFELYVTKQGDAATLITSAAASGVLGSDVSSIGGFASSGSPFRNPLGDFFVFTDRALTPTQITTLATGKPVTSIAPPLVLLQFRNGFQTTEVNVGSGGATYNATAAGDGAFTTAVDFYTLKSPAVAAMHSYRQRRA